MASFCSKGYAVTFVPSINNGTGEKLVFAFQAKDFLAFRLLGAVVRTAGV